MNSDSDQGQTTLKEYQRLSAADFGIKVHRDAVSLANQTDNDQISLEIFSVNFDEIDTSSAKIAGKDYLIDQDLFNKIKRFVSDNLDTLISWSKEQTNSVLENNVYIGNTSEITVKYGQLIININGQVADIEESCNSFINELRDLIINH